jgi:hypothetical protein
MVQTFFEFEGRKYKLKYQRISTTEGELYQGILFLQNIIGFSYVKANDNSILFDNEFLNKAYRDLIVHVIEQKEKKFEK